MKPNPMQINYKAVLIGLFSSVLTLGLKAQTLEWAKQIGTINREFTAGLRLDRQSNLISTGTFDGIVDFDPGPGVFYYNPTGASDIFIQKLSPEGNFSWVKTIGGADYDSASDISLDKDGNIYVTGLFRDDVDFDPGTGISLLSSKGGYDVFIEKLDSAGNFLWARTMGGILDEDVQSIRIDTNGNVYTAGVFAHKVDFNPGPDSFFLSSQSLSEDAFIQKLDRDGNFLWAKQFGGGFGDKVTGLEFDPSGRLLICGEFSGPAILMDTLTIDTILVGAGVSDIFLLQLDRDGQFFQVQCFGGPNRDYSGPMAVDTSGNVVMVGSFRGSADFDPGPDTLLLTSIQLYDAVVWRLDAGGQIQWAQQFGDSPLGAPYAQDILLDSKGQIFMTGMFKGTGDFDPGPAEFNLSSVNNSLDIFIQKLAPDGALLWAHSMGNSNLDGGCWVEMDSFGNLLLTGSFRNNMDVDPGPDTTTLTSGGFENIFILKWQQGFDFYGRVFHDANANQVFDPGEKPLPGVIIGVPGVGRYSSTNTLGQYHIDANLIGDTLTPLLLHRYWTVTPTFHIPDSSQVAMDFAVNIPPGIQDLGISALELTNFVPGESNQFIVQLINYGTASSDSSTVKLAFKMPVDWLTILTINPQPLFVAGDSLEWRVGPLEPDSTFTIRLNLYTAAEAIPASLVSWTAEVGLPNDENPLDNIFSSVTPIVGAFDPNDKQVSPKQVSASALDTTRLRYVIRFQNVGNAPARKVVIRDTLSADLRLASLRILSASHAYNWQLSGQGFLEIRFPDINLPDSTNNEPSSHGFVLFELVPDHQLIAGDSVLNRAGIYFDQNASVLTPYAVFRVASDQDGDGFDSLQDCDDQDAGINPVAMDIPGNGIDENCDGQDAVSSVNALRETLLQLQPNPTHDVVQVWFGQTVNGILEVRAADGRLIQTKQIEHQTSSKISLIAFPAGIYTVRLIEKDRLIRVGKVVLR